MLCLWKIRGKRQAVDSQIHVRTLSRSVMPPPSNSQTDIIVFGKIKQFQVSYGYGVCVGGGGVFDYIMEGVPRPKANII